MSTEHYTAKDILSLIADFLLPRVCTVCGRPLLLHEAHICASCASELPFTLFETMDSNPMALKFNGLIAAEEMKEDAVERAGETSEKGKEGNTEEIRDLQENVYLNPNGCETFSPEMDKSQTIKPLHRCVYAYAMALLYYTADSGYDRIPQSLKYSHNLAEGRFFADILGNRLVSAPWFADVDAVVPVPLHWARKWKRGYNQAEIIAERVAAALNAPLRTDILVRKRHTATQTRLSVEDKQKNVAGAFGASRTFCNRIHSLSSGSRTIATDKSGNGSRSDYKTIGSNNPPATEPGFHTRECNWHPVGKTNQHTTGHNNAAPHHILLVDDVFTTGSTMIACWNVLHGIFPDARISVATLSFVSD